MSESIWAAPTSGSTNNPSAPTPWRRGASNPPTTSTSTSRYASTRGSSSSTHARGGGRGRGSSSSYSSSNTYSSSSITSSPGLRQARASLGGPAPSKMDLLLSPSRGLQHGEGGKEDDLTSERVQNEYWEHVMGKVEKWEKRWGSVEEGLMMVEEEGRDEGEKRRKEEELGIVLLDLRKLREGLTSSRRIDAFTAQVYEFSVRLSLLSRTSSTSTTYLRACLPTLVSHVHPSLFSSPSPSTSSQDKEDPSISSLLSNLSLSTPSSIKNSESQTTYFTLNLLHFLLSTSPPQLSSFHPQLSSYTSSCPPTTSVSTSEILFTTTIYTSLLHRNPLPISSLLFPTPPTTSNSLILHQRLLRLHLPTLREYFWPLFEKSYKVFDPETRFWRRVLLFDFEGEKGVEEAREWLKVKGKVQ